jgi:hypothetical protein
MLSEEGKPVLIKVVSKGTNDFTADADHEEPAIRAAILTGDAAHIRSEIMDYTDGREPEHEEYVTVTEDDGSVLWAGWLSWHLDAEPAPGTLTVDMHRWYAVIKHEGGTLVIGHTENGVSQYGSVAEWEAANS